MKLFRNLVIGSIGIFLFASCKKEETVPEFHTNYFGLTAGRFVVYDVQEINHDIDNAIQHDTLSYQLKTVIGDTVIDNLGRVARKFLRYKRQDVNQNWQLTDVWTAILDGTLAELTEENQRLVKLILPPTTSKVWNPNSYTTLPALEAYYSGIHTSKTIGNIAFDSTLTVQQEDYFSMIDYRRKYEVYATGIGLVKKVYIDLVIEGFDKTNVQKGKEIEYTCIDYGVE